MQSRELVASALGQNLYTAIVIIAHPPGDPQDMSLALNKPAEADPLYASAHEEPAGFDWLFSRHLEPVVILSEEISLAFARLIRSRRIPIVSNVRGRFGEFQSDSIEEGLAVPP
jgi:hypothetical protein